jgi:hypothetical protein
LKQTVPNPVRFIHIVRNPYDNIATLALKDTHDLASAIQFYFQLCQVNEKISRQAGFANVLTLKHEDVIANPEDVLTSICNFFDQPAETDWLTSCTGIIADRPSRSREKINWIPEAVQTIKTNIRNYGFLDGYSYEN